MASSYQGYLVHAWDYAIISGARRARRLRAGEAAAAVAKGAGSDVVTVHKEGVPVTTDLPGRTSPYLVAQVRARVDGIVLRRDFKEGGDVRANQRLDQIDPAPYRATLDSALGTLQKARSNAKGGSERPVYETPDRKSLLVPA
jgi:multidrug efflux pump subunit AcrA (membrane-fusion protein)